MGQPGASAGPATTTGRENSAAVRNWLFGKAGTIAGGSFEVQNNIITKRILGLPELTGKA